MADVPKGRFVWYELMTTDPDAATGFYQDVAEWGTEPWANSPEPYTVLLNGQRPLGGVMAIPAEAAQGGMPPMWTAYVCTDDVDATIEKAKELGAHLLFGPMDLPEVGRVAMLSDPQGAAFSIYRPEGDAPGGDYPPVPGDFSWHELATTDHAAAFSFYSELFGWEKTSDFDMGEMGLYQMYGQDGREYGGMFNKPADMPFPPHWLLYIHVTDVDDAVDRVTKNGGQVLNGPMEVPGGDRVAQCMDPQGAVFALHAKAKG